ncbi:hypothetical protein HNQ91_002466 [Filimonas zeae]|uniref:Uncharacterized protein n=1 Tax=Filimonas zeae TaxID=1737353 RepID=A0A917IT93_9BACT|nr:hypothetical protein [Filimonas zeae]MDR6339415.1 hypothetical protein [Filimonas zeae]GGH63694.1 hypothetical protein GCM10011379_14900 [Filimonas zeae]
MPVFRYVLTILFFFVICQIAHAQLTKKDFKLLLDGKAYKQTDSIAVSDLLKVKEVTGNFPWLQIKDITIYITMHRDSAVHAIPTILGIRGNVITEEVRQQFRRLKATNLVCISVGATNKAGQPIEISELFLIIKKEE